MICEDGLGGIAKIDQATVDFIPQTAYPSQLCVEERKNDIGLRPDTALGSTTFGSSPRASTEGMFKLLVHSAIAL